MYVRTPNEHQYRRFWTTLYGKDHFVFSVKACAHVLVLLCTVPFNAHEQCYEIELGRTVDGDGSNVIRDGVLGTILHKNEEPNLLDCDFHRAFWVAFNEENIRVGKNGVVNELEFINWRHPEGSLPAITSVAVATTQGNTGHWHFLDSEGW